MVNISNYLRMVKSNKSIMQFRYWKNDDRFGVPFYYHGLCIVCVLFDPWNGNLLKSSFDAYMEGLSDDSKELTFTEIRQKHRMGICSSLAYYIDDGEDFGMTPLIHIPNIRTYAILNKKEYGGWTAMDFCPCCGAKFPERLDGTLSEILQNEYGLASWKDYKKAPHEFWTDEWWKKRGL